MYNFIIVILERVAKGEQEFWAGKCKLLPTKVLMKNIESKRIKFKIKASKKAINNDFKRKIVLIKKG